MTESVVFSQQAKEEAELLDLVEPGLSTPELTSAASSSDEPGNLFVIGFFFLLSSPPPPPPPHRVFFHIQISKTHLRCLCCGMCSFHFSAKLCSNIICRSKVSIKKARKDIQKPYSCMFYTVSFFICIEDIAIYVFSGYGVRPWKLNQ